MTLLRGITWDHPRGRDPLVGLGTLFERTHPGVSVTWATRSLQDFADLPLERLTDEYDLMIIDHPHIPLVAPRQLLLALDGQGHDEELALLAGQSLGQSHSSYELDGHQWALPVDAAAQVAAFRPDLIGIPPSTWEEVLDLAARGRVLWPAKPVDAMSSFSTLLANRGAPLRASSSRLVPAEDGHAVLAQLRALARLVPDACLDQNPIEVAEQLATGDHYAYAPLLFGYTNYSRSGFRAHRLSYVDIPEGPMGLTGSCLGGAGIAVSAASRHRSLAVDYAFWIASAEVQAGGYYLHGGQPANAAAWEDRFLNEDSLDFFAATRRTLEAAVVRPRTAWWLDLQDALGTEVNRALRGQIDDETCLERIEAAYSRLANTGSG